jgi:hypothetical protein
LADLDFNLRSEEEVTQERQVKVANELAEQGLTREGAVAFAAGKGFFDTFRGIKQILGVDEERMAEDEAKLNQIFEHPEHGTAARIAYMGGLVADPVGWLVPVSKARTVAKLAKVGLAWGAASGTLGYVDPEGGFDRLEQAALGAIGGAVAAPVLGKAFQGADNLIGKVGAPVDEVQKMDLSSLGIDFRRTTPKQIQSLVGELKDKPFRLGAETKKFYSNIAGEPLKKFVFNNPGGILGGGAGVIAGQAITDDSLLSEEDQDFNQTIGTILGFTIGYAGAKGVSKAKLFGSNRTLGDLFGKGFIDNYGLSNDYIKLKQQALQNENHIAFQFVDIAERASKLNPTQSKMLYNILDEGTGAPPELAELTNDARKMIKDTGQLMVDYGLLDPDVFKKNINSYINRSYLTKEADKVKNKGFKKEIDQLKTIGDELKARGKTKEVAAANVSQYKKDGWEVLGPSVLTKGKVTIRKQLTKVQRLAMGEIEDAAFALAKTGRLMSRDYAAFKFYDDLDKNFALPSNDITSLGGLTNLKPAVRELLEKGDELVKITEGKLKGTLVNKWGNLEGKYLPRSIVDDLQIRQGFEDLSSIPYVGTGVKAYRELNQWWKISKTAWNPTVHMNNFMANIVMFDLADGNLTKNVNYSNVAEAIKDFVTDSAVLREAKEMGVLSSDLFSVELRKKTKDVLAIYEKNLANPIRGKKGILEMGTGLAKALSGSSKGGIPADFYRWEDQIFRLGLYRTRLEQGFSPEDAAKEARKWFIDYDINAPFINLMRETVTPFLAYSYRAIPLIAETTITKPWKMAKWAALGYSLNYLGDEGDQEETRKLLPPHQAGKFFGVNIFPPRMLQLPLHIEGKPVYQDFTRWAPTGDAFELTDRDTIPYLPSPLQPSFGFAGAVVTGLLGYDMFTKKELDGLGYSGWEDVKIKSSFIVKQLLPNLPAIPVGNQRVIPFKIPFTYIESFSSAKVTRAVKGMNEADPFRDDLSTWNALAQSFGIKIHPMDLDKLSIRKQMEFVGVTGKLSALREQSRPIAERYQSTAMSLDQSLEAGSITQKQYIERLEEAVIIYHDEFLEHGKKMARLNIDYAKIFGDKEDVEDFRVDAVEALEEQELELKALKDSRTKFSKGGEVSAFMIRKKM